MQAIYVEHLLKADELSRLQQGGAGLAAVDSPLASLLMGRAYSQKELDRTEDRKSAGWSWSIMLRHVGVQGSQSTRLVSRCSARGPSPGKT